MSEEQILEQLYDLIDDRKSLMGSDEETNSIYKKDIQAIKTILEENQLLKLELSGYRQSILNDKEMLGLKEENTQLKIQISAREEEYRKLEDNWNKLKDYIVNEYYMFLPLEANTNAITTLINKMKELERGVSDE